jgi:uncharacterized protein (DUF2062 family)
MPRKTLRRYLPNAAKIRQYRALRPVSRWLQNPEIWHLHRRSVSGATFIGLFCAFIPVPFQMLIAAVLAIAARVNLPLAVAWVWVTNPLTIPPMFYFAYRLGAWLLDMRIEVSTVELSWAWLSANIGNIGYPLVFGSLVCGWVAGVSGMVIVRILWRFHVIRRWRERRHQRALRRAARSRLSP